MEYYTDLIVNRKGINDIYSTYLVEVKGLYFDKLSSLSIVYVMEGEVTIFLENEYKIFQKGNIVILNQFENKFMYSNGENLLLILNICTNYLYELGNVYYIARFHNNISDPIINSIILKNMLSLYQSADHFNRRDLNINIVKSVLQLLIRNFAYVSNIQNGFEEKSYFVREIENFINSDKKNNMNLQLMADNLHVSNSHLSKVFNELVGINFTEYVQQLRLFYSITYILNTKVTLDGISDIVGLGSAKSLNRIFTKYLNITPAKFRKNYEQIKDFYDRNQLLKELFNKFQTLSYSEFTEKNSNYIKEHIINLNRIPKQYNNVEIKELNLYKSWNSIVNLNTIGSNIVEEIIDILKDFKISEIILRFDLKDDALILHDIGKEINEFELSDLLSTCIENKLRIIIGLNFGDIYRNVNIEELNTLVVTRCRRFCNIISNAVGTNAMKSFFYLLNLDLISKFIDDESKVHEYMSLIHKQQDVIIKKLKTENINWGYELGVFNESEVERFKKISDFINTKGENIYPKIISLSYDSTEQKSISTILDFEKLKSKFKEILEESESIFGYENCEIDRVYIRNAFEHMDISDVNYLYRDLFLATLIMNTMSVSLEKAKFITDFKLTDRNQEKGFYYPRYKDIREFYTPIYWISIIMYNIKGDLIYSNEGCFVSKDDEDIYVLIYGNVVSDYLFAKQNGIVNLDSKFREVNLLIKGLSGKYKISTSKVSFENGTAGYYLKNHDNYKYLSSWEKSYIKRMAVPKIDINIKELHGIYRDKVKIAPFNFILKRYTKL